MLKNQADKPLSQKTAPAEPVPPSKIPLPAGCKEEQIMGNEPISSFEIGDAITGTIIDIKPVQTPAMKKPNNLITFNDDVLGRVKFWSSGALNQLLSSNPTMKDQRVTIQRIEDHAFQKGTGQNWRIFIHQTPA